MIRFQALLCCAVFVFFGCSGPSPTGVTSEECNTILTEQLAALHSAERISSQNPQAAWQRLQVLSKYFNPPALASVLGSDSIERLSLEDPCMPSQRIRYAVYDEWWELLEDQASAAMLSRTGPCAPWARTVGLTEIATHVLNVSELVPQAGRRDRTIRHLAAVLEEWGREYGVSVPPPWSTAGTKTFESLYGNISDGQIAAIPTGC